MTSPVESRVLVLMATERDNERAVDLLGAASIDCVVCGGLAGLQQEIGVGAGVVLLTDDEGSGDCWGFRPSRTRNAFQWRRDFPCDDHAPQPKVVEYALRINKKEWQDVIASERSFTSNEDSQKFESSVGICGCQCKRHQGT